MATPAEMVTTIETALAETPVGMVSFESDGTKINWSRDRALRELDYWRKRHAVSTKSRRTVRGFDLSRGAL